MRYICTIDCISTDWLHTASLCQCAVSVCCVANQHPYTVGQWKWSWEFVRPARHGVHLSCVYHASCSISGCSGWWLRSRLTNGCMEGVYIIDLLLHRRRWSPYNIYQGSLTALCYPEEPTFQIFLAMLIFSLFSESRKGVNILSLVRFPFWPPSTVPHANKPSKYVWVTEWTVCIVLIFR